MRLLKIMLITLGLCVVSILWLSCGSESDTAAVSENQTVTVQRGDLRIDITASGNLELSLKEDLAFEISGTVEEVLVEEGDTVEEGQVLAKLDISEWESELTALERQLTAAKRDLLQAEINLNNAKLTLEKAEEETTDRLEIEAKELQVELAQGRVEDAQKEIEDAQEELDEALEAGPEITAPFAGFITKVNVDGGDEIKKGTVAVSLADPNKFEANILVSEMDIFQVQLGAQASVQVDAMPMLNLPAEVTDISPTATIQSGVVNYTVKVEMEPLQSIMQQRQEARQEAVEGITQGELPERLKQAIEEGRITQEQAEEMMKQMQQAQGGQQGQVPTAIPEDFRLREGLTVTVSIIVDERNDVLLVPNGAITTQGRQTYVQVLSPDGTIEERAVTSGISNWQYTEVTDGLSEGEKVLVPKGTTTTPATQQQRPPMIVPGMRPR